MNKLILLLLIVFLSGCLEEVKQEYYPNGKAQIRDALQKWQAGRDDQRIL
jgi:PBP1b-binding outer membrane lipoprotein LpoB